MHRPTRSTLLLFPLLVSSAPPAGADQVIADDIIVQGSNCVGTGCAPNVAFGFDTLLLSGDVLRIQFTDTSSTSGFPTTDWQITANDDDAVGTESHFSIEDLDAGTVPFTLEAGAPTGSVHVASDGSVGLGTSTPTAGFTLDVAGSVRADEAIEVTGSVGNGAKAGIIPAELFTNGEATVAFTAPFAGDYAVLLTVVTDKASKNTRPTLVAQDTNGFTVTVGRKTSKRLVELHWIAQAVGE